MIGRLYKIIKRKEQETWLVTNEQLYLDKMWSRPTAANGLAVQQFLWNAYTPDN